MFPQVYSLYDFYHEDLFHFVKDLFGIYLESRVICLFVCLCLDLNPTPQKGVNIWHSNPDSPDMPFCLGYGAKFETTGRNCRDPRLLRVLRIRARGGLSLSYNIYTTPSKARGSPGNGSEETQKQQDRETGCEMLICDSWIWKWRHGPDLIADCLWKTYRRLGLSTDNHELWKEQHHAPSLRNYCKLLGFYRSGGHSLWSAGNLRAHQVHDHTDNSVYGHAIQVSVFWNVEDLSQVWFLN